MNLKPNIKITTQQIALVAIFAALYFVLSLIAPIKIPTGIGELSISFAALLATIMGLVLGPYLGAGAALLGATVTWSLLGMSPFDFPFLLSPMFNALITGLIFYKRWKWAFAVFGIMMIAFLFTPPVTTPTVPPIPPNWYVAVSVLFDKVAAILLILPLALFGKKMSIVYGAAFFFLLGFVGNQADNMWGSLAFSIPVVYNGIFGFDVSAVQGYFVVAPFLYPAIRLIQAFMVMIIAVPLMHTLKTTKLLWRKDNILEDDQTGMEKLQKQIAKNP